MGRLKAGLQKQTLRVLLPWLRQTPAWMSGAVVDAMGWFNYVVVPGNRRDYSERIKRGRIDLGESWDDAAVARRYATGLVQWRSRDRLLDGLTDEDARGRFTINGRDHLDEAYSGNRGVILLGNHFGTHLHPSHWLFRERYPLRLFMERPRNVSKYLTEQFQTSGPLGQEKLFISRKSSPTEAAGSILRAMQILKAGMILQIAGDVRWQGSHTAPADFLGSTYLFSTTWVVLAAMTSAPVVPVFCRPDQGGRSLIEFQPSFRVPTDAVRSGRTAEYVQRALDNVVNQVRRHPDLSNDYFTWPRPSIGLVRVA